VRSETAATLKEPLRSAVAEWVRPNLDRGEVRACRLIEEESVVGLHVFVETNFVVLSVRKAGVRGS